MLYKTMYGIVKMHYLSSLCIVQQMGLYSQTLIAFTRVRVGGLKQYNVSINTHGECLQTLQFSVNDN